MPKSKIGIGPETPIQFGGTGADIVWSPTTIANGNGQQSETYSNTATSRKNRFQLWFEAGNVTGPPTLRATIDIYINAYRGEGSPGPGQSDRPEGDLVVNSEDELLNMDFIGSAVIDNASAARRFVMKKTVEIDDRHWAVVMWNRSGGTTSAAAADTFLIAVPVPYEAE